MSRTAAVVTVSDGVFAGERDDGSGALAEELLREAGFAVPERRLVPDERAGIVAALTELVDAGVALVVTTGGTGLAPRDVTPEATLKVADRVVPGFGEAMRAASTTPMAPLSRAIAATRGAALIVNLPGSVNGATEMLRAVLAIIPHALELLAGTANVHERGTMKDER